MRPGSTLWVVGTGVVALLLAAGAWLLLFYPTMERTVEAAEAREAAEDQNDRLRQQITVLAADFERLDELRTELDTLRTQFPTAIELPAFTRGLSDLAESTGARVRSVTVGASQTVTAVPDLPEAPDGTPAPTFPEAPGNLFAVPISLTVEGTFEQAKQFASDLQGEHQRLFLLSRLSWTGTDQDGSETFSINGHTYVLATGSAATEE